VVWKLRYRVSSYEEIMAYIPGKVRKPAAFPAGRLSGQAILFTFVDKKLFSQYNTLRNY